MADRNKISQRERERESKSSPDFLFTLNAVSKTVFFIMKKAKKFYKKQFKDFKFYCRDNRQSVISMTLVILICSLAFGAVKVRAGSLTPSSAPAASGYTLGDIYTRLTTNGTATAGNHSLATTTSPAGTFYTLTQIYNAIPTIDAAFVKLGTTTLGVAGTLTPNGGTAAAADLFSAKTANLTADWDLDTGTLTLACATTTFDGIFNKVPDAYDGIGNGANRWCITDSGDATTGDILSGKIAWVDGAPVTGSISIKTGDNTASSTATSTEKLMFTPALGYYDGITTVSTTSTAFVAGNIRSGTYLFGIVGTMAAGYTYGSSDITQVLTSAGAGAGTYNVTNLANDVIRQGTTWGASLGSTGTLLPSGGTATAADVASGKTFFGAAQANWTLQTGTFDPWTNQKNQIMDDWLNGAGTTGTYNEYIGEEASWSAVSGSPFNAGFATSSQALNYYPVGANIYLASGQVKQDTRTGLWWSDVSSTGAVTAVATSTTNDFWITPSDPARLAGKGDGTRPTATGQWDTTATTTVKNGNAINFCNALNAISFAGYADWYLPTQKELMQAYIDGAANNLPNAGYTFWSSTESYSDPTLAWRVSLSFGPTTSSTKLFSLYVRCVRRP